MKKALSIVKTETEYSRLLQINVHYLLLVSQEAICSSLEEYNQHIEELKQEMEEATESAKRIREDIQEMRNKYGLVDSQEKCAACDFPLLNRPFYLFLCGHMFHYDCLFQVTSQGCFHTAFSMSVSAMFVCRV